MGRPKERDIKKFVSKVHVTDTCWLWTGGLSDGYGVFDWNGTSGLAHRYSYETLKADIPDGLTIDHLCRIRRCVNPDHLEPATMAVNVLRGENPTAINARKTLCKRGHLLPQKNLAHKRPHRECRICKTERQRERRDALKIEEGIHENQEK